MKRIVSASLIALVLIGLMGGGFFYFNKYRNTSDKAINAIPPDASFFIDYYADAGNLKKILNSSFISDSRHENGWKKIVSSLERLDSLVATNASLREVLKSCHLIISVHVTKAADFDFLYLLSLPPGISESKCEEWVKLFAGDPAAELQSRNYDGVMIKEIALPDGSSFTFTVTKGVFAGSYTSFLVEDAIRQQKLKKPFGGDKSFLNLYTSTSVHHEDKIYINYNSLPKWLNVFTDAEKNNPFLLLGNFGGWTCLVLQTEKDHLRFNGISASVDSNKFMSLFENQLPPEMKLPSILPSKTSAFIYYGMSNSKKYFNDLKKFLAKNENGIEKERLLSSLNNTYNTSLVEKLQSWIGNEYAFVITEPASTNFDNNILAVFSATDLDLALRNLRSLSSIVASRQSSRITEEKYNGHFIGLINLKNVIPALYGDIFKKLNKMYFTSVRGYVIISNQASALRSFIDDYENKNFLFPDDEKNILKKQSTTANFCLFSRIPGCQYIFKSVGSSQAIAFVDQYKELAQWDGFSFMIKNTNQGIETSAYIQYAQKPVSGVNLVWSSELDTNVACGPFFVSMEGDQKGIMVQDALNNLYLLDNAGNISWKKLLSEKILGTVYALDIFKNGQVQYLFNTAGYLNLLDANGINMSNYPIRLPVHATNGSSVFDYDENNDYRIYIACENGKVYGYQPSGKPLPGWNSASFTGTVSEPLQHFKHNDLDYLIFNDSQGQVFITGKMGEALISVKQKLFKSSESLFYLDEDKEGNFSFVTLDSSGNICSIMPDGFIRVHPVMENGKDQGFVMADLNHDDENDYLFNDGKQLNKYENDSISTFARIPGEATEPIILLLKSKSGDIKIGTWSSISDKLFLFNTDGSLYKGFPVRGSYRFYMDEINNDGRKNIVSASGKEVLLYVLK